jgi:molybdenum cofactor cytidylyltransferase
MFNSFAIIPAAGRSARMGAAKLLLPWYGGTVLGCVLKAWKRSRVTHQVVVIHPEDEVLAERCVEAGVDVVRAASPTADMKASIGVGLTFIRQRYQPDRGDVWLVAPSDIPDLSHEVIDRLLAEHCVAAPLILVPVWQSRRGHPALFPWPLVDEVARLGDDEGVDSLLLRFPYREIPCSQKAVAPDVDTPDDYARRYRPDTR